MKLKFQIRKQSKINKNFRMGGLDYYPSKFRHQEERDEKEKRREYDRQYYENNKEKNLEKMRLYRENNKKQIRQYNRTPKRIEGSRISNWKKYGVKLPDDYPDWSIFYDEEYMKTTHCEECLVELTEDKRNTPTTKVLDHNHQTGEFRNIICHACNIKRR